MEKLEVFNEITIAIFEKNNNDILESLLKGDKEANDFFVDIAKLFYFFKNATDDKAVLSMHVTERYIQFAISLYIKRCTLGGEIALDQESQTKYMDYILNKYENEEIPKPIYDIYYNMQRELWINNSYKTYLSIINTQVQLYLLSQLLIVADRYINQPILAIQNHDKVMYILYEMLKYYSSQILENKVFKTASKDLWERMNVDVADAGIGGAIAGSLLFGPLGMLLGGAYSSYKANKKKLF